MLGQLLLPFGGPPTWVELDAAAVDYHSDTGEIWLPSTIFGFPFTEIELTYTAGYAQVPPAVKLACAQIIRNLESHPAPQVRTAQLDRLQLEYFEGSLVDDDARRLLAPFIALRLN